MSALAEALLAARRSAVSAMQKPYVAGVLTAEEVSARLNVIGCDDAVDGAQLLAAWDILREFGTPAAQNGAPTTERPPKMMTAPQKRRIELDCKDRGWQAPDFGAVQITLDEASEIIGSIRDGSYDPARWNPPF